MIYKIFGGNKNQKHVFKEIQGVSFKMLLSRNFKRVHDCMNPAADV